MHEFFWEETDHSRKIHLINWKDLSKPKASGGLGIRHNRDVNQAFIMKNGWGLVERKDALWARVIRAKYNYGSDLLPRVERKNKSSNLWKGICLAWKGVEKNHIWRIGDGSSIKFWKHNWVPNLGILTQYCDQVLTETNLSVFPTDFLSVSGDWDEDKLKEWLPDSIVEKIRALSPPSPWKGHDSVAWAPTSDGTFSLKSAYSSLNDEHNDSDKIFKLI
ncbi:Putative ribonuclease H protein [Arachis hypogaea]|nr:Putative ribonuclease H protein [Arachis hypogaea]